MTTLPALFLGHGSPMTLIERSPTHDFLAGLGLRLGRPRAVLCVSAHWETARPEVTATVAPETIHDFYGFPAELYQARYDAPGSPRLAERVAELLAAAGLPCEAEPRRGLDHGAWIPLALMFPAADIPVVQLSLQPRRDAAYHIALGRALAPLRDEDVLVLGSGNLTHNLAEAMTWLRAGGTGEATWAAEFAAWMTRALGAGDAAALAAWQEQAPHAGRAHPSPEHLLPLHVAFGAGAGVAGTLLHDAMELGSLSMAAFAFGALPAAD